MSDHSRSSNPGRLRPALFALALGISACGDPLTLPPATLETVELSFTLYALTNTSVGTPSAYNMITLATVRTDRSIDLDFAVDMVGGTAGDSAVVIIPRGALGFQLDGGVQLAAEPFDSIVLAPVNGYVEDAPLPVDSGDVVLVASRLQQCNFGINRPRYAKLRVESVNRAQRSIAFKIRIDPNCGYRGLAPGIPSN
ncbi:MAG: hypothetical protein Q7J79_05500 [Gemmatimonadales bacterium]|nr:hypothetical protein [Gemmatimonadales bacterium]